MEGVLVVVGFYKDIELFVEDIEIEFYDFEVNGIVIFDNVSVLVYLMLEFVGQEVEFVFDENGDFIFIIVFIENGSYSIVVNNVEGGYICGLEIVYM